MTANYRNLPRLNAAEWWTDTRERRLPILDVRSPCEFRKGAIPSAINTPLFTDEERAEVGTEFKNSGRIPAIQLGLERLSSHVDSSLSGWIQNLEKDREFGIYCARGGMRSYSVALFLASMGYRPILLNGGYKSFRGHVIRLIDEIASKQILTIVGRTGVGKTLLIRQLTGKTACLDLEGYANHRGSVFGDLNQKEQPATQQNFENKMAEAYLPLQQSPKIMMEIEDSIGPVMVPGKLRQNIRVAPMLELTAEQPVRVQRIHEEYIAATSESANQAIIERVTLLKKHLSNAQRSEIEKYITTGNIEAAINQLLNLRYDKMYNRSLERQRDRIIATIDCSQNFNEAQNFVKKYISS